MLQLKVLGGLSIWRDGHPLSGALAQPRRLAVLALLARGGQVGVPRDRLIATLWPDVDEERARHTLNQTLYAIRRELGDDEAIVGIRDLRLNNELLAVDATDFHAAAAERDLQRAAELYEGPFLDGFHLAGADEFERWVERERASLERAYTTVLEQLARDATTREDHVRAVGWWRTRAARDPLDARVAIALMQALDAAGDRRGAIQHARVYELLIDEELSLPPDREVVRYAEELRREQFAVAEVATAPAAVPATEIPTAAPAPAIAPPDAVADGPRRSVRRLRHPLSFLVAASLVGVVALGTFAVRRGRPAGDEAAPITAVAPPVDSRANVTTSSVAAYRMYEQGLRAHFRGERTVARTFFEAAVAEDSLFALAHYYSALVADDVTEGRRRLERARQLATRASDRERLTIMAGWASAMSAPSLRAIADTLAIRYPTEMAGYLSLGIALVSDGEYLGALGPLGHVLAMDSTGLHSAAAGWAACAALRWTVTAYQLADSLAAAERVARRWVRLHPGSRAAVQALVEVLDVQGRGPAADSALRATGSRVIDDAEALYRRASSLMRGGDFDAADRLIGEVLEAGGVHEQVDAYWLLAISLRQQGRLSEALDATRHMRAIAPRTSQQIPGSAPSLAALEAQILLELGRPRAAAALFDSIARGREQLDSKHTAARRAAWTLTHVASARAAALDTVALDRLADGIQSLGTLSGYGRDRRLHHHVRGLLLAARGDGEGAVAEFRQSIFSWNYGYTRTNLELARTLMRLGRAAEAVAVLQPALRGSVEASNLYVTRTELHELLAESWDAANGRDSAVAHYRVVARAWNRADPHLQPRRARAEARAAELAYRPCGPGACAGHNGK